MTRADARDSARHQASIVLITETAWQARPPRPPVVTVHVPKGA
jgi:hypothetical protein